MDELKHYGVKGMKWGVRKSPQKTRTPAYRVSEGNKKARAALTRNSIITGMKVATPLLAIGLTYALGPDAEPAILAGKEAVRRVLDIATIANLSYGSTAAMISDVSTIAYNKNLAKRSQ